VKSLTPSPAAAAGNPSLAPPGTKSQEPKE